MFPRKAWEQEEIILLMEAEPYSTSASMTSYHLIGRILSKAQNTTLSLRPLHQSAHTTGRIIEAEPYSTSASMTSSSSAFFASGLAPPCSFAYIASASL